MRNYFKNILLLALTIALSFATLYAQQPNKKKKKPVKRHTAASKKPVATTENAPAIVPPNLSTEVTLKKVNTSDLTLIKDTTGTDTTSSSTEVVITSSFKPSLRNAAKINFTAATPVLDTSKLQLTYTIPSQNLFFSYQPLPIKPLALAADSGFIWEQHDYLKAGYGNYSSPYLEGGASFGDGVNTMVTAHGKYESAKGNLPLQQYGKAGIDLIGIFITKSNQEITSKLYWDNNSVYRYGYQPDTLKVAKDTLHQKFNTIGAELGLQNKKTTAYGITYHPQIKFNIFNNTSASKETNLLIKAPINKSFGRLFSLDLGLNADITHYSTNQFYDTAAVNNNLYNFNTSLKFTTPNLKANLGLIPSWDNGQFSLLPNFTAEGKLADKRLVVEGGWIGYYQKNTYKSLAGFNPYIISPSTLFNTKTTEEYIGLKGGIDKHLTVNAKLSFLKMDNVALFANDTSTGKSQDFIILNEPSLLALRLQGEISYAIQENLSILAGVTYTQFTKLSVNNKAYGLLPLEINGTLRWKVLNDLTLKSDVFFFDGSYYRNTKMQASKLNPAFDANLGAEFPVSKKLNAWIQLNNFLDDKYQRWNQYQVLGFQLLAGVVYSFR
jgi:hypothetical protein